MIDLHSHLLPGVDDGSRSAELSAQVLRRFLGDGIEAVVCTPHLLASRASEAPLDRHREILVDLRLHVGDSPALLLGWEIMLDEMGADLTRPGLTLGGSRTILVEFPRMGVPMRATQELARLTEAGLRPLVAHPERYFGCSVSHVKEWRSVGAVIQCEAVSFAGTARVPRLARALLAEGLVDILASDNHGDSRTLAAPRRWLEELGEGEAAVLLTSTNPRALLQDGGLMPVPPVVPPRGALERLRNLILGRD
jgi:protein-tyrosine phosphatase